MSASEASQIYDAYYFAHGCGRPYARDEVWLNFFGGIAARIASDIGPRTVLDAGCAWGFLVEQLRALEVDAYGVDISEYAIQQAHESIRPFVWVGSITDPLPRRFDLIVSIEVLEHMPKADAELAVVNLCRHTDDVLFSSTPFDYKEATHFNVQPPEYWAELFARQGFFRDVDFDASFLTPWAVRFRRKDEPVVRMVKEYERKFFLLWKENADLRSLIGEMRGQISGYAETLAAYQERAESDAARLAAFANQVEVEKARANELQITNAQLQNQLAEIFNSQSWKLIQRFQALRLKLIPRGGSVEKMLGKLFGSHK